MSPFIHRRIMELAKIDGTYELFDIKPERLRDEVPLLMRELDGFNCTIPHKEKLAEILNALFPVNTFFRGKGFNTDCAGFRTCGIDFSGMEVVILGAGGTARMMQEECQRAGAKSVTMCTRKMIMECGDLSPLSGGDLSPCVGTTFINTAASRLGKAAINRRTPDILLNATPLGMWPCAWKMPPVTSLLRPGVDVFDAVYNPFPTRLVLNARKHGARATGGLRMLVRQAIEAQKIWNPEKSFDTAVLESKILPLVSRELLRHSPVHFALTGFMGAGKSSLAKEIAGRLGIACVDVDAEIEARTGRDIARIFRRDGEAAFRKIESETVADILRRGTSSVVATGGGLPVSDENQKLIRETNTFVLHLDVPFETLWQRAGVDTETRPLLKNERQARALHDERRPVYLAFCDFSFDATQPLSQLAAGVIARLTHTGD